jgi:predicted PurR-regulated permease PerM
VEQHLHPGMKMPHSQVSLKTVFTIAFGLLIALAFVMAILHSLLAITLSCAALLLALALDHIVQMLVKLGMGRSLAVVAVALLLLGLLTGIGFILIPPAISQGKELIRHAPDYIHHVQRSALFHRLDHRFDLTERLKDLEGDYGTMITGAATPVLAAVGGVLSFIGASVTIFFLTIFMLIFGGRVIRGVLHELSPARRPTYDNLLHKIYQSIGGYIAGLALICGINATLTITFLAINKMPFFLPLGILSGLSSTIPYAGPFVTGTFISLLAFITGGLWHGVATVIYFLVYGQIEGNILAPLIFRRTVRVNPLVVTLSILFLGEIAGISGAIIAVPIVAALQIVLRELLLLRAPQSRPLGAECDARSGPPPEGAAERQMP